MLVEGENYDGVSANESDADDDLERFVSYPIGTFYSNAV